MFFNKQAKRKLITLLDLYGLDSKSNRGKLLFYIIWLLIISIYILFTKLIIDLFDFPVIHLGGVFIYFMLVYSTLSGLLSTIITWVINRKMK
jgi:hypothetical protein